MTLRPLRSEAGRSIGDSHIRDRYVSRSILSAVWGLIRYFPSPRKRHLDSLRYGICQHIALRGPPIPPPLAHITGLQGYVPKSRRCNIWRVGNIGGSAQLAGMHGNYRVESQFLRTKDIPYCN